ncbi:MAG: glycosyltransferase family 39 protein [Deltaproteobacteria bacterium]|nr:glycosyltransferase family 39 protein [Deltaproteobacteria bacterium]
MNGMRDHAIGALVAVAYTALLVVTAPELGPARDEGFYSVIGDRYARWVVRVFDEGAAALDGRVVDRVWADNSEHPPLPKLLFGLSASAVRASGVPMSAGTAHRLPTMIGAGLLLWIVYVLGARIANRRTGIFAAGALAAIPHVFHHAHLAAMDVLVVLACVATTYAYWRSLERARWAWVAGVVYGLALLTKHNAWFLPPVLLVHWATLRAAPVDERLPASRRIPWGIVAMLTLGPLMLIALWPWLWRDTLHRWMEYVRFHVEHVHYPIEYMGTTWFEPPFPAHYALGSMLTTVPSTLLVLAIVGIVHRRQQLVPPWLARLLRRRRDGEGEVPERRRVITTRLVHGADPRHTDLLILLSLLWPIVLLSTTRAPIFGGTKHFLAAYPFLALFAAVGFLRVARAFRGLWSAWRGPGPERFPDVRRRLIETCVALVLLAPAVAQTAHAHPYALAAYVPLVGGAPGGADLGMNRQYWGHTNADVLAVIRRELPRGGSVFPGDTALAAWRAMMLDGHVPRGVLPTPDLASADLVLVHHEPHFLTVDAQAWVAHGSAVPVAVIDHDGVPVVSVYARPGGRARSAGRR